MLDKEFQILNHPEIEILCCQDFLFFMTNTVMHHLVDRVDGSNFGNYKILAHLNTFLVQIFL